MIDEKEVPQEENNDQEPIPDESTADDKGKIISMKEYQNKKIFKRENEILNIVVKGLIADNTSKPPDDGKQAS